MQKQEYPKMVYKGGKPDPKAECKLVENEEQHAEQLKAWGELDGDKEPESDPPESPSGGESSDEDGDEDLADMTLPQLKALADLRGLEYPKKIKKDDLIELLEQSEGE